MSISKLLFCYISLIISFAGCSDVPLDRYCISFDEKDSLAKECAEYMYNQTNRFAGGEFAVLGKTEDMRVKNVYLEIDETLDYDYSLDRWAPTRIKLKARNKETMYWLVNQLLKQTSREDKRLNTAALPPAWLDIDNSHTMKFAFEYREPYYAPNMEGDNSIFLGTNVVERDWGIWGHNLKNVLRQDARDDIYAKQQGLLRRNQYCFSGEETFRQIKAYIIDNYGDGTDLPTRFMILPNDNKVVCTCDYCKAKGNTADNATPAVSSLVVRLAGTFPKHTFFTSAYLTTTAAPKEKWPDNTGVMLSTINLPNGVVLQNQPEVLEFLQLMKRWKAVTPKIYIWDYASNFDDYLSPLPSTFSLKHQLQFYHAHGVTGVFLNASGYDYSSFDDVKTYIAAVLLMNPDIHIDELVKEYYRQYYPVSAEKLYANYLKFEKDNDIRRYYLYGNFAQTLETALIDMKAFKFFYEQVDTLRKLATGDELLRLNKLYAALNFTCLQYMYNKGSGKYGYAIKKDDELEVKPQLGKYIEGLELCRNYPDFKQYKEEGGSLEVYLAEWRRIQAESPYRNYLLDKDIKLISPLGEDYKTLYMLNDGVPGFAHDYLQGWWLYHGGDLHLQLDATSLKNGRLSMRFLVDKRHGMYAPMTVEIYNNNARYKVLDVPDDPMDETVHAVSVETEIDFSRIQVVRIKVQKNINPDCRSIACDEIRLY